MERVYSIVPITSTLKIIHQAELQQVAKFDVQYMRNPSYGYRLEAA